VAAAGVTLRALDLFCGAGGSARGLQNAGFWVLGIDHRAQPRYAGDAFIQADALRPPIRLEAFDLIWASPPCQAFSIANTRWGYEYPDLIDGTRAMLLAAGVPFVIENVATAPIRADVVLVGSMFDLDIARRRHFEIQGFAAPFALIPQTTKTTMNGGLACVAGHGANRGRWKGSWSTMPAELRARLSARNCKAGWQEAMDIDWMRRDELAQAIPPAYSEFIARAFLRGHSVDGGLNRWLRPT
jgi:DNA (cytosine-5)-methyltransferase 1